MRSEYTVSGMTCEHCENRVAQEVLEIPGVTAARAEHASGALIITSDTVIARSAVADAVDEAGYALLDA